MTTTRLPCGCLNHDGGPYHDDCGDRPRKRIRFWTYAPNGALVRVKVKAGQTIRHGYAAQTDEGWTHACETWTFDGYTLHSEFVEASRDCDGRHDHCAQAEFSAGDERGGSVNDEGIAFPLWDHGHTEHRDHTAEAAGY